MDEVGGEAQGGRNDRSPRAHPALACGCGEDAICRSWRHPQRHLMHVLNSVGSGARRLGVPVGSSDGSILLCFEFCWFEY